jgi:hypothetical protein
MAIQLGYNRVKMPTRILGHDYGADGTVELVGCQMSAVRPPAGAEDLASEVVKFAHETKRSRNVLRRIFRHATTSAAVKANRAGIESRYKLTGIHAALFLSIRPSADSSSSNDNPGVFIHSGNVRWFVLQ